MTLLQHGWSRYGPYQDDQWDSEGAERCEILSSDEEEPYLNWSFWGIRSRVFLVEMEFSRCSKALWWCWRVSVPQPLLLEGLYGYRTTGNFSWFGWNSTRQWYMRLGHIGEKNLQVLKKKWLLKDAKTCKLEFCEHCVIGNKTKVKFGTTIHHIEEILDYVHMDVWGLTKMASLKCMHYFMSFIDDFSRRCWVFTMDTKEKSYICLWSERSVWEIYMNIKVLCSDNGSKYTSDLFLQLCLGKGTKRHFTIR